MKRFFSITLVFCMLLSLASFAEVDSQTSTNNPLFQQKQDLTQKANHYKELITNDKNPENVLKTSPTKETEQREELDIIPGMLLVKFKNNISPVDRSNKFKSSSVQFKSCSNFQNFSCIKLDNPNMQQNYISSLKYNSDIEYVEPLYIYKSSQQSDLTFETVAHEVYSQDDPYYMKDWQWGLQAINIYDSWGSTSESALSNIKIAIVDSGVDLDHPDLAANIIDGYDFVNNDSIPDDDNGHGTHVAGIAAAIRNNQEGIAGVAGGAKIMPVKVLDSYGWGNSLDIYKGIVYAVNNGADVINLSLSSEYPSLIIKEAVDYAYNKGVVVVAAAGNNYSSLKTYPAAYDSVIAVGSVNWSKNIGYYKSGFSNYGSYIDVVAPGNEILSTFPIELDMGLNNFNDLDADGYTLLNGTSMSASYVSGYVALILATNHFTSPFEVLQEIISNTIDLGAEGKDEYYGYGLINLGCNYTNNEPIYFPNIYIYISDVLDNPSLKNVRLTCYKSKDLIDQATSTAISLNTTKFRGDFFSWDNKKDLELFELLVDSTTVAATDIICENGSCSTQISF